jgi:pimeloyl-ACP methyl ester carboxylesterase
LAFYIAEAVRLLQWTAGTPAPASTPATTTEDSSPSAVSSTPFTLIGHSMGAAISCMYAASFPEQVQKLVLLEGGTFDVSTGRNRLFSVYEHTISCSPLQKIAKHIRQHVERRQLGNALLQSKAPRVYESLQKAVETRCQTARNFPGKQYLSEGAATEMVLRGSKPVHGENNGNGGSGIQFRHDPRLQWPSAVYFTNEQVEAVYQDIQCPTALLLSIDGWPFDAQKNERALDILKPTVFKTLPGSHHFHTDLDTADAVVAEVLAFLQSP